MIMATFIHINNYYINVDHIYCVKENEKEHTVYFAMGGGDVMTIVVPRSEDKPSPVMQALQDAAKIIGG